MNFFTDEELSCPCCGVNKFNPVTLARLNELRAAIKRPIVIVSAYRCEAHNKKIGATQTHATGQAVDIDIRGVDCVEFISHAWRLGFTGYGFDVKDGKIRIRHIDDLQKSATVSRPAQWWYK